MQLQAYVTVNGSKPSRSMLTYTFDKAKVSDLCFFAAAKCLCPPSSSFTVSVEGGDGSRCNVEPSVDLAADQKMFVIIDPPATDTSTFVLPGASQPRSLPSTPGCSHLSQSFLGDESMSGTSSTSTQRSTAVVTPGALIKQLDSFNVLAAVSSLLESSTSGSSQDVIGKPGTSQDHVDARLSPTALLVAVYFGKRDEVETSYKEMKPAEAAMVNKIDVLEFFDSYVRKAALHVLKNPGSFNLELIAAAKTICKKSLVDILVKAYPDYSYPSNPHLPATDFLALATGNPWFNDLRASDGSHLILNSFKKRHSRFLKSQNPGEPSTPTAKKRKLIENAPDEDLEDAVLAIARCSNPAELEKLVADSAKLRGSWIKKLEDGFAPQILETFFKKFPVFVADASLLHEDYKFNMIHVRALPAVNFGEIFYALIPAIFRVALEHKLIPGCTEPTDYDANAWLACNLLIRLVPLYVKRNTNCKPERLFVEAWDLTSINAMHQTRRDIKQPAPMIYVFTNYVSGMKTFYVAADDVALKVPGSICDAIQSLMELHHIFDLAYAKELKPFFQLLETFGDVNPRRGYSTLSDLRYALKRAADAIDEENEMAQRNPGVEMAQRNPGEEMAQRNPGEEMAQENPGDDWAQENPGNELAQENPGDEAAEPWNQQETPEEGEIIVVE